jgi:oligopeptidase B
MGQHTAAWPRPYYKEAAMTHNTLTPPTAKRVTHRFEHLGRQFVDEYAWLQAKSDPEVLAYLEAENAYARATLEPTEALQEQLFQEMKGRIQEDDVSAPEPFGEFSYYSRLEAGRQYRVFCRRRHEQQEEEVLLDENALAEGHSYCRVAVFEPSPDNALLAYGVDTTGSWVFDLFVKDLHSGELIGAPIPNTAWTVAWASDCRTLFYTVFDDAHRSYKLFRHTVGDDPSKDVLVYHESDEAFSVHVNRTRSGAYILLTLASHSTSEVRYLPAGEPLGEFQIVHPRQPWLEYYVEHHGDRFVIRTNDRAENFKLVEAAVGSPGKEQWREVVAHRADTYLEEVDLFRDHLVAYERRDGLPQIRISAVDGTSEVHYVALPDPVYTYRTAKNPEFDTGVLRFYYSSLVTPESTVDYDMTSRTWQVSKQQEIPSGYDASLYTSERLHAVADDGSRVPISLVYRKGLPRDGSHPLLLYGYGAYGYSSEPSFDTRRISLLDRGFACAIAHVRGGSEMGRAWYEQGRLMHKRNSFTDLITCAEHLIAQGYTSPQRLAIMGGSAGGLLVSAATNLRPDLFQAVVAMVPFTNVITAMLMPDLPLTVTEWEQWGHPQDREAFEYMLSYSPYDNVEAKAYPHLYVKAGLNDLQVPYWDPAKWVAKLRANKTDENRLVLVTNMGAGHSGASGRYDHLREDAQVYAFLIGAVLGAQESET